jgi:hypothetical protein
LPENQADAVRKEFDLFCKIGADESLRAAVMAIPLADLGLEDDADFCPLDRRDQVLEMSLEVSDKTGILEQLVQMEMTLGRFVRLRRFIQRFDVQQVLAFQESLSR